MTIDMEKIRALLKEALLLIEDNSNDKRERTYLLTSNNKRWMFVLGHYQRLKRPFTRDEMACTFMSEARPELSLEEAKNNLSNVYSYAIRQGWMEKTEDDKFTFSQRFEALAKRLGRIVTAEDIEEEAEQ
jgi:6-phosphofructokinase